MALLKSGTRIYGNAQIDTYLKVDGTDAATSNTTGALVVSGGIGASGNIIASGNIVSFNANLGNLAVANYIQGTLTTSSQPNITSLGELTGLTVNGNTVLNGNLVVSGLTTTITSNNTSYVDSIIELHTQANLAPLTTDDSKDIGVRVHYFKSSDKHAFFGVANDTLNFEYYVDGSETSGVFSGTYGNFKGASYISTVTTGNAPFVVNSTTEVANLTAQFANVANTANNSNTATTVTANAQPNITSVGILSALTVTGLKTFGLPSSLKITGGYSGEFLQTDGTGNLSWAFPVGFGNANIYGNATEVQYNLNDNLRSSPAFTFNETSNTLTVTKIVANGASLTNITGANVTGFVPNANVSNTAYSVAGANVSGTVANANYSAYAGEAFSVTGSNVTGTVANANYAVYSGTAYSVNGSNVTGTVANANYSTYAGSADTATYVTGNAQSNITSVGTLTSLNVSGNILSGNANLGNAARANYFVGDGSLLTGIITSSGNGDANITNLNISGNANIGNLNSNTVTISHVANLNIPGGTAGQVLITDGNSNLTFSNYFACVISNVSNIVAGSALDVSVDYSNTTYRGGIFTINQLGPVSVTATDIWEGSTATKNAYANYIASTVNTSNISITLSLANANFNIQSSDTLTFGSSTVTGANLLALNITNTGGTYVIPSGYLSAANTQTNASVPVTFNLTTSRGAKSGSGTTLVNNQPVPFNVTALSGTFGSATVPYWNLNQTFNWSATVSSGATGITGNVTYANTANSVSGTLTSVGATSGTSSSLDSTLTYTLTSTDYNGTGQYGAGQRTIPSTVTGTVNPATKYYPLFWKVTGSSVVPSFTTSDSHNSNNYATGQGANTSSTSTDYLWLATPNNTSHTFKHIFLGSDIVDTPDVDSNITISGQAYRVWGFTNFSSVTTILTTT